jgi:hypothetical protein
MNFKSRKWTNHIVTLSREAEISSRLRCGAQFRSIAIQRVAARARIALRLAFHVLARGLNSKFVHSPTLTSLQLRDPYDTATTRSAVRPVSIGSAIERAALWGGLTPA